MASSVSIGSDLDSLYRPEEPPPRHLIKLLQTAFNQPGRVARVFSLTVFPNLIGSSISIHENYELVKLAWKWPEFTPVARAMEP